MRVTPRQVARSSAAYPITGLYVGAVLLAVPFTMGRVGLIGGLVFLTGFAVVALLVATLREVRRTRAAAPDPDPSTVRTDRNRGGTDAT